MKRRVRAFTLLEYGTIHNLTYRTRKLAMNVYGRGCETKDGRRRIIPIIIEYDDGKRPRAKKGKKR